MMSWGRLAATFACLWLAWIAFTGSVDWQELAVGALASACIAAISYEFLFHGGMKEKFKLSRLAYGLAYVPAYMWEEVKAHTGVIRFILHPRMPIRPGIVKVPTDLRTDFGITGLANAITMTPGTISVEVDEAEPSLYVHWIDVKSEDPLLAREYIAKPFERFLRRIFG